MKENPILLLYVYAHHHVAVDRLAEEMAKKGLMVDTFCIYSFGGKKKSSVKWPFYLPIIRWVAEKKVPILSKVANHLIEHVTIDLIKRYQYVDFHCYSSEYYSSINFCISHQIKYDITLWGSDLLRAESSKIEAMKIGFAHAHTIKSAKSVLSALSVIYNREYDTKARYADFGNSEFDYIDNLDPKFEEFMFPQLFPNYKKGQTIICCGYNASPKQQHVNIIKSLSELSRNQKSEVYVVILFSYGASEDYYLSLKRTLDDSGLSFHFIRDYLNQEEIAVLRKNTDLVINMQETDAFSFSLQEHLYCNNVLIIGEWLQYVELDEGKVYYIKADFNTLTIKIADVLQNIKKYRSLCQYNQLLMNKIISWGSVSNHWYKAYVE